VDVIVLNIESLPLIPGERELGLPAPPPPTVIG
jgi:hypothetical protein